MEPTTDNYHVLDYRSLEMEKRKIRMYSNKKYQQPPPKKKSNKRKKQQTNKQKTKNKKNTKKTQSNNTNTTTPTTSKKQTTNINRKTHTEIRRMGQQLTNSGPYVWTLDCRGLLTSVFPLQQSFWVELIPTSNKISDHLNRMRLCPMAITQRQRTLNILLSKTYTCLRKTFKDVTCTINVATRPVLIGCCEWQTDRAIERFEAIFCLKNFFGH